MKLTSWGQTDVGRARDHNEDALVVDPSIHFYMVADGVGGGAAGEVASSMATQIVHGRIGAAAERLGLAADPGRVRSVVLQELTRAINEASEAIYARGSQDSRCRGMATTVVAVKIDGNSAVVGHVGDSRLYLIRDNVIYQVTEDHTLLQRLLQTGALPPEEAANFPHKNVIARSVGKSPAVKVDTLVVDVHPGDRLVMCSDGLSDLVTPDEIKGVVEQAEPQPAVERLIATANSRGGPDNVTVILLEAGGDQPALTTLRTEQKAGVLREVFLFKELNFQELLRVLTVVHEQRYSDGDLIIREDDFGDSFYIIVHGAANVTQGGIFLTRVTEGGHFGELGLLGDGRRSATVRAVGNTVCLSITKEDFYHLVSSDHGLSVKLLWGFLQNVAGRMKTLSAELSQIRSKS